LRHLRIALTLIALCICAAVLAACGGGSSEESPQQILEGVSLEGVESAAFDLSLGIESKGRQGGNVEVSVSGQAESEGVEATATVAGTAQGKAVDFEGGLTLFADHGFVNYQGTEYEIDPSNYSFAKSLFLPALSDEARKNGTDLRACAEAASGTPAGDLVEGLRNEGTVEVDGTETTKLSGELDVPAAVEAMIELAEEPSCRDQFEGISPWPLYKLRLIGDELVDTPGKTRIAIYVDNDGIVRKVSVELTADPKGAGREPVTADLELSLSEINGDHKIQVPSGAKPLGVLFGKLGVNPIEFLGWSSGGEGVRSLAEKVAADAFP
jgi:hypothetical protein